MLYKSRQAVIKLFNNYSPIVSEAKHKIKYGVGRPLDLARIAKVFDRTRLKILSPKKILANKRLSIALAQAKLGNTSENFLNETRQINKKKLLKTYTTI